MSPWWVSFHLWWWNGFFETTVLTRNPPLILRDPKLSIGVSKNGMKSSNELMVLICFNLKLNMHQKGFKDITVGVLKPNNPRVYPF